MRSKVIPHARIIHRSILLATLCVARAAVCAPDTSAPVLMLDPRTANFAPGQTTDKQKKKVPVGNAEKVLGQFGPAVKFTFVEAAAGGFFTAAVHPSVQWDQADGFSFWVKGDGSNNWGGIQLIDRDDYSSRYAYCFPIDSTDWRKITVRWSDLTPELASPMVDAKTGYAPSHFGNFWVGKWFYWRDYPAESFTLDRISLERTIPPESQPASMHPGIARFAGKLRARKPVTIVTMGDSLSDSHHWSNQKILWSRLLADALKSKYGSEVTLVNPAIGGTTLSQNMVLMPRWLKPHPAPDLVIVWYGGNDWDSGVRGPRFEQYLAVAVERIRRQTHGAADVLLLSTCPGYARWQTLRELEQAVERVAREKKTGFVDIAAEFRKAGTPDEAMKREYWAWDKVHLGRAGHELVKDAILQQIEAAK
jgi:lysophospholipase L1-like esterase